MSSLFFNSHLFRVWPSLLVLRTLSWSYFMKKEIIAV